MWLVSHWLDRSFLFLFFFVLLLFLFLLLFFLFFSTLDFTLFLRFRSRFLDLAHHHHEISLFNTKFLDSVIVVNCLPLENYLEWVSRHAFSLLNFSLKSNNLNRLRGTLSVGSTYTEKISPLRFLIFSFISTQILFKYRNNSLLLVIIYDNSTHQTNSPYTHRYHPPQPHKFSLSLSSFLTAFH